MEKPPTVSQNCLEKEIIDVNNIHWKDNFAKKYNGIWYKISQPPTINDNLSDYLLVKESKCAISHRDQHIVQIKQEIELLKKEVEELKLIETSKEYDNIICDCISLFYKIIVRKVNSDHKDIKLPIWDLLNDAAKNNAIIFGYINEVVASFNISFEQWTKIREFSNKRNVGSHFDGSQDVCVKNTLSILVNNTNNAFPKELKSSLMIIAVAVLNEK